MKKVNIFFLIIVVLLFNACFAKNNKEQYDLRGKVVKVADGDTFTLIANNKKYRIRMYGIDAPESSQEYGKVSGKYLSNIILKKTVDIKQMDTDKYGRVVGKVFFNNEDINLKMLETGNAWFYEYHAKKEKDYREAAEHAKKARLGLWAGDNIENPREYRIKAKSSH